MRCPCDVGRWLDGCAVWVLAGLMSVAAFAPVARGDGMMVSRIEVGRATDMVSSPKQEALLITDGRAVAVVLRTHFEGGPAELAWLVPVPAEPTHIVARDDAVFTRLELATAPQFYTWEPSEGVGFGCATTATHVSVEQPVKREATGMAGIFQYDVLAADRRRN